MLCSFQLFIGKLCYNNNDIFSIIFHTVDSENLHIQKHKNWQKLLSLLPGILHHG